MGESNIDKYGLSDNKPTNVKNYYNLRDPRVHELLETYWRRNLQIMGILLAIWAFVSLGCGILFADLLNYIHIAGFPLGFWFAQQGSIVTFVILILVYCILLNRLDMKHHEELESIKNETQENKKSKVSEAQS